MTQTAVLATQLNSHAAHPWGLFIDGLDVIKEPATPSRYGVAIESVKVSEAGPGGVSSMSFVIDDPSLVISPADAAEVRFHDFTRDLPIFLGSLQSIATTPAFGGQGRLLEVQAAGIESMLDRVIVPSQTATTADTDSLGVSERAPAFIQQVAGLTPLRQQSGGSRSAQAQPVALGLNYPGLAQNVTLDGMTVRQAIEAWLAAADPTGFKGSAGGLAVALTVDPWGGVRAFIWGAGAGTTNNPSDYATITLTDTAAGAIAASGLRWTRDFSPGSVITAVYVKGGNAAGTGWVVGDTTKGRAEAFVSDSGVLTEAGKQAAGAAVLGRRGSGAGRGELTLEDFTPVNAHPGSNLVITDTPMGWSAKTLVISQIDKTFLASGLQNWRLNFFDPNDAPTAGPPSAVRLIRTLTRAVN